MNTDAQQALETVANLPPPDGWFPATVKPRDGEHIIALCAQKYTPTLNFDSAGIDTLRASHFQQIPQLKWEQFKYYDDIWCWPDVMVWRRA